MSKAVVAAMCIGTLFGASATLVYQGKQYDNLYMKYQQQIQDNRDLQQQNDQLQGRISRSNKTPIIESIKVQADAPDGLSEIEAVQLVKQDLAFLVGKPLDSLQKYPELPYKLLDGKTLTIDNQQYTIHVQSVVIGTVVFVSVKVTTGKSS